MCLCTRMVPRCHGQVGWGMCQTPCTQHTALAFWACRLHKTVETGHQLTAAHTCTQHTSVCAACCLSDTCPQVVCEGRLYTRWLTRQLEAAGAHFVQRKLSSLAELAGEGWDVVVNCSGLGAQQLLPDRNSYPIRGQIMRVKAPWVNQCVFAHFPDETAYIIPNR
jgi:glycine/D-amino acid oxidase-like deaminating enzyme